MKVKTSFHFLKNNTLKYFLIKNYYYYYLDFYNQNLENFFPLIKNTKYLNSFKF